MNIAIPYGRGSLSFAADERSLLFTGGMADAPAVADARRAVLGALDAPVGTPPLRELARGKRDILFLVEDNTRETPLKELLSAVVGYLNENGISDDRISLLVAAGTHRPMTGAELTEKFGGELLARLQISRHDAYDEASLQSLGAVEAMGYGVPLLVNRRVLAADLVVGFGNIIPHCNAGFSGGGKIVVPGVSGSATVAAVHAAAAFHPGVPLGDNETNPCRAAIEAGAARAGLNFIVNVVLNQKNEIAGVFAGNFIEAHRLGSALAAAIFKTEVPQRADVVVAGSYPADADYWQAGKGLAAAFMAVKRGGVIVLAAECGEGLAHNHPRYREYLRLGLEENLNFIRNVDPGDAEADVTAASVAAENCRIRAWADVFIVAAALRRDSRATVGVIPEGGRVLPAVG